MKITDIQLIRLREELDPPFVAAWDPQPRRSFSATIVVVETDEGVTGYGSGDTMDGFEGYRGLFLGTDPLNIAEQSRRIASVNFHAGRFWPLEVACWDVLGKVAGLPVAQLLGGARTRVSAYASTGSLMPPAQRAESAMRIREAGFRAMKIRIDPHAVSEGVATVRAVREAVGDTLDIIVDLNQAWRMAGDTGRTVDRVSVQRLVEQLQDFDILWLEEPLHADDLTGMRRLGAAGDMRVAGGEMEDSLPYFLRCLELDALDVYQPDAVLSLGISRSRMLAELVLHHNRWFTPHTWTNGIGLLANLQLAAGVGGGPYLEFPFDPPGWTPARRDFMLAEPLTIDDGCLSVPDAPGLGLVLDDEALERWRIS
jgi:D-galactarolactone cycloisomerase